MPLSPYSNTTTLHYSNIQRGGAIQPRAAQLILSKLNPGTVPLIHMPRKVRPFLRIIVRIVWLAAPCPGFDPNQEANHKCR